MANKQDLEFTYNTLDKIFRLSLGEMADYTGARYEGNFKLSLDQAQLAKHKFIADSLSIQKGSKVLDIGCGWGPFLNFIRKERQANGIGLTLSGKQAESCLRNGLNVLIQDFREVNEKTFGLFDAVVSVGSFEHFCSPEEYLQGYQEKIYSDFFSRIASLLPKGGRCYIQTMVFGKNMIDYHQLNLNAPRYSAPRTCALLMHEFPGTWLPYGYEMVERAASPNFNLISKSSGRLDYIETIRQWKKAYSKFNLKKYLLYASKIPELIFNKEFRIQFAVMRESPNRTVFEKEIFEHYRFVFEKK